MKKILALFFTVIFISLALCACGPSEKMLNAYADDAIIAEKSDSYYLKKSSVKCEKSECRAQFDYFCGVRTLTNLTLDGEKTFDVELTTFEGDFKLVLVKGDEVIVLADGDFRGDVIKTDLSGTYKLKMVGRECSAKFVIKL